MDTTLADGTIPSVRIARRRPFNVARVIDSLECRAEVERALSGRGSPQPAFAIVTTFAATSGLMLQKVAAS